MNEVPRFLTFTLRSPAAGIAMAKAALDLNPCCSAELWNTLGDAYFEVGKVAESKNAYQRALRINPSDIRARFARISIPANKRTHHAGCQWQLLFAEHWIPEPNLQEQLLGRAFRSAT